MNAKTLGVMVVSAGLLAGLAWYVSTSRAPAPTAAGARARLLPGLEESVNNAARLEIRKGPNHAVIVKAGEAWALESKGGYPVAVEKIRPVLLSLARAEVLSEKTSNPELYARMSVQDPPADAPPPDPTKSGGVPTLVSVSDQTGKPLASLIVGDREKGASASDKPGTFVRRVGEKQALLSSEIASIDANLSAWVDPKILEIPQTRIASVVIEQAGGERLEIEKRAPAVGPVADAQPPTGPDFIVKNLPEGRELKSPTQGSVIAGALGYCTFEDVAKKDTIFADGVAGAVEVGKTTFVTTEGLRIGIRFRKVGEKTWASFEPEALATEGSQTPTEAITKEASELSAKLGGYAFALPPYSLTNLTSTMAAILKEIPRDQPAPQPEPQPSPQPGSQEPQAPSLNPGG